MNERVQNPENPTSAAPADANTSSTPDVTPAAPSPATPEAPAPETFADALKKAVAPSGPDEPSQIQSKETPPPGDADPKSAGDDKTKPSQPSPEGEGHVADEKAPDGASPEEVAARAEMSERNRRRFDKLLAERKAARDEASEAKPIVEYMKQHDIPKEDVDVVLGLAAQLRKGDFAGFLRTVAPYVNLAQQYVGQVLPPDLKQQVDEGLVSEAVARELARHRMQAQVTTQNTQRDAQRMQRENAELRANSIRSAVTEFERQIAAADPDFGAKKDAVRRFAQALIFEKGAPQTPEQAVELARAAYDEANRQFAAYQPKPRPTQPTPSSTHQSAQTPKPEPTSMREAMEMAARGG